MESGMLPLGTQICRALDARGVRTVFGIPGVHNQELYRGLAAAGLTHVLARHEQGAGFMADGYARATGEPGVAFVISGPGLVNILTPVGQAYSDSVPMLVIATCLGEQALLGGGGMLHELKDQRLAGEAVAEWSLVAPDAESAYLLIDRAFNEFSSCRPRPRIINIPVACLARPAPPPPEPPTRPERAVPDWPVVERVARLLDEATRPLFVLGGGAASAAAAADEAIRKSGSAVFLTYAGRGIVAADYPLNFGSLLARPESEAIIGSADLVIAVGTSLSETDLWRQELGHKSVMVRVDIDPGSFTGLAAGDIPVLGDSGAFLKALAGMINAPPGRTRWRADEVAADRERMIASCDAERRGIAGIARQVLDGLPEDTLIYSDMTQFAYVAKEVVNLRRPGQWSHPYGFGTLGYALPAAIGGKVACPERPVLAIAGDYGLQYTMQELGTLVDAGISITLMVWDNQGLGEIRNSMERSQIMPVATDAFLPDLSLLAQSYGLGYRRPATVDALAAAIRSGLAAPVSTIIHADAERLMAASD